MKLFFSKSENTKLYIMHVLSIYFRLPDLFTYHFTFFMLCDTSAVNCLVLPESTQSSMGQGQRKQGEFSPWISPRLLSLQEIFPHR